MIVYFSGTGNSEYVAKILAQKLDDSVVDATALIKNGESFEFDVQPLVFVSPVYAWRLPRVFAKFIKECKISRGAQVYFALTCGSSIGNAEKYIKKLCKSLEIELKGVCEIVAPENYIAMFSAPSDEEIPKILVNTKQKAEALAQEIKEGKKLSKVKVGLLGRFLSSMLVNGGFYTFSVSAKKFYSTDKCISCGKCVNSCMLNNIKLVDKKPIWSNNCTHCMACISKCPTLAIEYGRKTKKKKRYVCPKI